MKRNNIFKKLTAVFLIAAMLLSLTACSGNDSSPGSGNDGTVSLNLLEVNNNYFRNFTQAVKNSVRDIPLNIEYYSGSNATGYITQKLASQDPPDIVYFTNQLSDEFQQKYLLDLSSYDFLKNYNLSLVNHRDVDGAMYTVPANTRSYVCCTIIRRCLKNTAGKFPPLTMSWLLL